MFRFFETIVHMLTSLIELSLGLRFLFRILDANPASPFISWLYANTDPLLNPFRGIFPTLHLASGFTIEFTTLIAIIIYMLAGEILIWIASANGVRETA